MMNKEGNQERQDKKVVSRNVAFTLIAICTILAGSLVGAAVYYTFTISGKDSKIAAQTSQISSLQSQISNYAQVANIYVEVSGTASKTQNGTIYFGISNMTISYVVPIKNGIYSVLLVGGQWYNVMVNGPAVFETYSAYVPSGIATFTQNF